VPERMRIVFCGTPSFAVPTLKHLLAQTDFEVLAVITQPDRPRGRGMQISASPVKETALAAGVPVHQPEKIRAAESQEFLRRLSPDCIVIIAYGQIIPARLLSIPKHGWINLHASLLPKYRGAAPIQWAIANGETRTGLTTMRIDAGMDTGDMLLQKPMDILPADTTATLAMRLAEAGAPLMAETLRGLGAGTLAAKPQEHNQASYAPLLKKENGKIDWTHPAGEIYDRMRAFTPWPGAFTSFRANTYHISAEPVSDQIGGATPLSPGTLRIVKHFRSSPGIPGKLAALLVSCGGATELRVLSVKREGGKSVEAMEFAQGVRLTEGERFGEG
jgi:methionyl-tRNA formyltransferase